jgi:hypothetical protein
MGVCMTRAPKLKDEKSSTKEILKIEKAPMIFISHDSKDAELATAFSKLLSSVSAGVLKSFRSSDKKGNQGIEYGSEWYPELMNRLNEASDVVCLLTKRSLERPWLLYEAGVAKGKLDTSVFGIALGINLNQANTGPFAQFQNCDDDSESLTKLVMQLVQRIPGSAPDVDVISSQVANFKKSVSDALKVLDGAKSKETDKPIVDGTSVAKLFEEVKVMFRDLPTRLEDIQRDKVEMMQRRKIRRFHPAMFEEIRHILSQGENFALEIVIMLSLIKDEIPWLYEIGKEIADNIRAGDQKSTQNSTLSLLKSIDFTLHGGMMHEMIGITKETHAILYEIMERTESYYKVIINMQQSPKKRR